MEINYLNFILDQKRHYLTNVPSNLSSFIAVLEQITELHSSTIIPTLENPETTFLTVSQAIIEYIQVNFCH